MRLVQKIAERIHDDPDLERCCAWAVDGKRCCYPGSISHGTLGGGPWYCRFHVHCDGRDGAQIVDESRSEANRAAYYKTAPPRNEPVKRKEIQTQEEPGALG